MSLAEKLREEIERRGPLSVADYMAAALGDEQYGYYMHSDPLGLSGDFVTSPEISQIFGELVGIWCAETWHNLNSPECDLVELGPGRGTLMKDLLRATSHVSGFHDAVTVNLVEMSPTLSAVQRETLTDAHPRIRWHEALPETGRPLLVVANEFFDALPIRQFTTTETGFTERLIGWDRKQGFHFKPGPELTELPGDYPDIPAGTLPEGATLEICPLAQRIMLDIAVHIKTHGGAMLAIDYGYTRPQGVPVFASGDTLQAVRRHKFHEVLQEPGKADITAHVDFSVLAEIARAVGAEASETITQREFLMHMGGRIRMEQLCKNASSTEQQKQLMDGYGRLVALDGMGELFKLLAVTQPGFKPPVF